jgi:hypothetical protein
MQYKDLTPGMRNALTLLSKDLKFVDVRSAAALARRGLARYEPGRMNGHYAAAYYLTEKGSDMVAREHARLEVRKWQIERKEYFSPTICEIVEGFALWRNDQ